jgi:hypothetical protein
MYDPIKNGNNYEFSMDKLSPLNDSQSRQTIELSRVTGMYQPSGFIDDSKIIEML